MPRVALPIVCALVLSMLAACPKPSPKATRDAGSSDVTLFFTTELRGEIEPCGCNSDPLGDLSRLAALVEDARGKGAVAWLDGGSLLYSEPRLSASKQGQEQLKSDLIIAQTGKLGLKAAGLGAYDLADGKAKVRPPRQAANVGDDQGVALEPPHVLEIGGVKLGVFGLADPAALAPYDVKASDPLEAARKVVPELRKQGAQVIVALTQLDQSEARKLAQAGLGIDFVVVGRDAPDPTGPSGAGNGITATSGGATLILPTVRGQSVVRVELHVDAGAVGQPLVDAVGETRAKDRIALIEEQIAALQKRLDDWKKDPKADPTFLADQQAIIDRDRQEIAALEKNPVRKPAAGSWFTAAHVLIKRRLRCDAEVVAAKRAFDKAAAQKNLDAAVDEKPEAVPPGQAGYAGDEECASCHKKAVAFWKTTHHAQAWATLVHAGKDANRDCVACHVTGWMKPGGAVLIDVSKEEKLRNVQCESCHGPGSKHVDSDGQERTSLVKQPPRERCLECHTHEHSDTFDYTAYLRDVTGAGHGEELRKSLGDGPTGHELRKAALDKASAKLGEGCDK